MTSTLSTRELTITRQFSAPPHVVFNAWAGCFDELVGYLDGWKELR